MGAHRRAVALGGWSGTRVSTLATELPNTAPAEATWLGRGLTARGERRGVARLAWAWPRRTRAGVGGAGRAGAGGSHVGERAHMTGRTMDPLPSPAVAAAAEAEADEEADPPATGRHAARGPVWRARFLALGDHLSARHLAWLGGGGGGGHPGASLFPLFPGTLLFSPPLARGRVELHLGLF